MQNNTQNKNKERNKLEVAGKIILDDLKIKFIEQYLINNKITVDIYIPKYKLIIEWWSDYWYGYKNIIKKGTPDKRQFKRMALDIS
jgi:hypothetical protein